MKQKVSRKIKFCWLVVLSFRRRNVGRAERRLLSLIATALTTSRVAASLTLTTGHLATLATLNTAGSKALLLHGRIGILGHHILTVLHHPLMKGLVLKYFLMHRVGHGVGRHGPRVGHGIGRHRLHIPRRTKRYAAALHCSLLAALKAALLAALLILASTLPLSGSGGRLLAAHRRRRRGRGRRLGVLHFRRGLLRGRIAASRFLAMPLELAFELLDFFGGGHQGHAHALVLLDLGRRHAAVMGHLGLVAEGARNGHKLARDGPGRQQHQHTARAGQSACSARPGESREKKRRRKKKKKKKKKRKE